MPFTPKSAAPQPAQTPLLPQALEWAAEGGITLFTVPPGYLPADSLAMALRKAELPILWLRLGPEDRDPAALLVSLIAGMQGHCAGVGTATLERMRRQPGPVAGWPPLYASLSHELAEALPTGSAIVLENCHYLSDVSSTLRLLGDHILSPLSSQLTCILASERPLPPAALPVDIVCRGVGDLRLSAGTAQLLAEHMGCNLTQASIRRAVMLTEGQLAALCGLYMASTILGSAQIQQVLERASRLDDLLARIAQVWLIPASMAEQQALALVLRLGYAHPALLEAALGHTALPSGPWLVPLEDSWSCLRAIWQTPLRAALRLRSWPGPQALHRAADYLASQEAVEQALPIYFELGDRATAARVIATVATTYMGLGQWDNLDEWLSQLPIQTLNDWPWLVYIGGELAAGEGRIEAAQRAFTLASKLFTARHDACGSCQSLLAESTLAVWHGDRACAESRALAASAVAETAGMPWFQSWAAWQLGCLAVAADDLEAALTYFDRAASTAVALGDPLIVELPRQAERLTQQQRELRRQREFHRQAYFSVEQVEQAAAERLGLLLSSPPVTVDALLEAHGWSQLPLMLKLPAPDPDAAPIEIADQASLWSRLLGTIGLRSRLKAPQPSAHVAARSSIFTSQRSSGQAFEHEPVVPSQAYSSVPLAIALGAPVDATLAFDIAASVGFMAEPLLEPGLALELGGLPGGVPQAGQAAIGEASRPTLSAYLLGTFRVTLNDRPVESWPSGRGRSLFKYLLTHRERPVPRDVLMDLFWPDASPDSARNNLNVALHGLRQPFRALEDIQVVIFENGAYHLNPELRVWLDVDDFELRFQAGRRLEAAGQLAASAAEYEIVVGLYQNDFLIDDPYEEWPVLTRERLRVMYLEALDRLSQIYFSQGQYAACANLCQLILARDGCREDAHCRLMRCYSRQGQHPLALRQYQICVEVLRSELEIEPSPTTVELCEHIRRRTTV